VTREQLASAIALLRSYDESDGGMEDCGNLGSARRPGDWVKASDLLEALGFDPTRRLLEQDWRDRKIEQS